MNSKVLTVIIPCKDEQEAIGPVLERFLAARSKITSETFVDKVQLLVVDDDSQDGSLKRLRAFESDGIRVISCPQPLGYGGAIKIGMQAAEGDLVAIYDMDDTYDSMDLVPMLKKLADSGVGMVCGDRLSRLQGMPLSRHFGNRFFVGVIESIFRLRVRDCCTGMRVFDRRFISAFLKLLPNNLNFTLAMTILFLRFGIDFVEIPIAYGRRVGRSKLSVFIDGPRFLFTIIGYWLRYRFSPHNIQIARQFLREI